jgi:hypothetical protein
MAWNKDEEGCTYVFPVQQVDGNWIKWEDYARLKAEVERLKEDNRQLTKAFEIAEGIIKRMGKAAEDAAKEGKSSV